MKRLEGGSSVLDLPMAVLAALSVGFIAYAMPDALFSDAVAASGLPSLLPAAQPPLGATARLAVVAPAAVVAFLSTWLLLRVLGSGPSPIRRSREIGPDELPPLRIRRADAHPDAPLRRPLIAGLELGEPDPIQEPSEVEWEEPFSGFVEMEPAEVGEEWEEPAQECVEMETFAEAAPLVPMELEKATIAELMQRLEMGLARRQQKPEAADAADEPAPAPFPAVDDRLRSALDDLQRMAARRV